MTVLGYQPSELIERSLFAFITSSSRSSRRRGPGKGTGLGLATVYGTVKQSGGHIEVARQPGRGARFDIYLPVARAVQQPACNPVTVRPKGAGRCSSSKTKCRCGISSGERSNQAGTRCSSVTRGMPLKSPGRSSIDVFLLDVVVPGKSGPQVAVELRDIYPEARVLYMTGYTEHAVLERMQASDTARVLHKPFANSQLLATLREAVEGGAVCS